MMHVVRLGHRVPKGAVGRIAVGVIAAIAGAVIAAAVVDNVDPGTGKPIGWEPNPRGLSIAFGGGAVLVLVVAVIERSEQILRWWYVSDVRPTVVVMSDLRLWIPGAWAFYIASRSKLDPPALIAVAVICAIGCAVDRWTVPNTIRAMERVRREGRERLRLLDGLTSRQPTAEDRFTALAAAIDRMIAEVARLRSDPPPPGAHTSWWSWWKSRPRARRR